MGEDRPAPTATPTATVAAATEDPPKPPSDDEEGHPIGASWPSDDLCPFNSDDESAPICCCEVPKDSTSGESNELEGKPYFPPFAQTEPSPCAGGGGGLAPERDTLSASAKDSVLPPKPHPPSASAESGDLLLKPQRVNAESGDLLLKPQPVNAESAESGGDDSA